MHARERVNAKSPQAEDDTEKETVLSANDIGEEDGGIK